MKFWQSLSMAGPAEVDALAVHAEKLGFEGVILSDHLVTFEEETEARGGEDADWSMATPWPDPWVQIGALSHITKTLKFMTGVYVLPLRDPFSVAKAMSTACLLSGDRVALGIGVGWHQEEFKVVGQNFSDRGKRTDEMLVVIRKLLSGNVVEHAGDHYRFGRLCMSPGIATLPPVYVGGASSLAIRRAAQNQGWIGGHHDLTQLSGIARSLQAERERLGEAEAPFEIIANVRGLRPETCRLAEQVGVTIHYRNPWLDDEGRALGLSFEQKLKDMEDFAMRYIR